MVALVDGVYSQTEAEYLSQYCKALGLKREALDVLCQTVAEPSETPLEGATIHTARLVAPAQFEAHHDVLQPVRDWLDQLSIHDPKVARFLCNLIPAQCPFERDINLFGRKIAHIPPLCKLNPLYEQLVSLRFRALCYLADTCGEDVSPYC